MPFTDVLLLLAVGLAAGVVNAMAGGGTFFTFPILLSVGLPPIAANATSAFSLGPGSVASALAYRGEIAHHYRRFRLLSDFHRVNAAKNLLAVLIKLSAIILFIVAKVIYWPHALILTVSSVAGGYLGVLIAKRVPLRWVRLFVVAVGVALTIHYFLRVG
jgi:uncharacterized membrane protein YfcA